MDPKTAPQTALGQTLSYLRKKRGPAPLTQAELAEKLGISQGALANLEKGRRQPTDDLLKKIASVFGNSKSDTEDLLRRLRGLSLVDRNPELAELFEPRTSISHRGQYLPLDLLSELEQRMEERGYGLKGIGVLFDVPIEHLNAIRLREEPISALLLARLAELLGADPDDWAQRAGYLPEHQHRLMREDPQMREYFLALARLARTDPQRLRRLREASRGLWQDGSEEEAAG